MKILFFSWLSKSNINASIPLIRELVKNNHEVYYFGFEKFRNSIEKLNIKFIEYDDALRLGVDCFEEEVTNENFQEIVFKDIEEIVEDYKISYERTINLYLNYVAECEKKAEQLKADLIIKDNSAQHGKILGFRLKIKTIAFSPMMIIDKNYLARDFKALYFHCDKDRIKNFSNLELREVYDKLEAFSKKFCLKNNLPYITLIEPQNGEDELSIVYGGEPLNPNLRDERVKFIKPPLQIMDGFSEIDTELKEFMGTESPLIYISSGAMINGDNNYYSNFIRALWNKNVKVIISIPSLNKYNKKLPSNFLIRDFVPQQEILKKASLFISFGGYNSICEAIEYEVPMLIYPQMNDQFLNASRIEELEIGVDISKFELNKDNLEKLVDIILTNNKYKNNIVKIKKEFNSLNKMNSIINYI